MLNYQFLSTQAQIARNHILDMIYKAKSSHLGCALSVVDILIALYLGNVLKINPQEPNWEDRDRFILSKGHACVALYVVLGMKGFFPMHRLQTYGKNGTRIADHNTLGSLPGVETTNGSLGHGLSLGIGMALAAKKAGTQTKIFVLVGDGELQEGSNWEALMFAGFHQINNLVLIIDNNRLETVGQTDKILSLSPLPQKMISFGWSTTNIDGHNFEEIISQTKKETPNPHAIIAKTIKAKGIPFMEEDYIWHGQCPNEEEYRRAKQELNGSGQ